MSESKKEKYERLLSLFKDTKKENKSIHLMTMYSELCNFLKNEFAYMDWVGFYLISDDKEELYLGPYVGDSACENISIYKGVCGKCYRERLTQRVDDVSHILYHIACSSSTKSEIVIPLMHNDECLGVLDIDSDNLSSFDKDDEQYLKSICYIITK